MTKYKLIANPAAGRGRANAADRKVAKLFEAKGVYFDLEFTKGPRDAAGIARKALADFDVIVAVGGDGTVNEIIPAMLFSHKPFGIIPTGSGNDFIKSLNIPSDIEAAVDVVLRGKTKVIDAGRINQTYFVNGVGIGFDAAVNHASYTINHSKRGLYLYLCALFKTLGKYRPVQLKIVMNGETNEEEMFMVTIGNGTTCGGGFKLTPHAKLDDQLFDVTFVRPLGILPLLWHFPKVFLGTIEKAKYARLERTSKITIKSSLHIPVHVDGEVYSGKYQSYVIEVIPHALKVVTNN
jgi:diacylglycerol kinase (ATP)